MQPRTVIRPATFRPTVRDELRGCESEQEDGKTQNYRVGVQNVYTTSHTRRTTQVDGNTQDYGWENVELRERNFTRRINRAERPATFRPTVRSQSFTDRLEYANHMHIVGKSYTQKDPQIIPLGGQVQCGDQCRGKCVRVWSVSCDGKINKNKYEWERKIKPYNHTPNLTMLPNGPRVFFP